MRQASCYMEGLMEFDQWLQRCNEDKPYAHFDLPVKLESVINYIQNKNNITTHSFKPFIHNAMSMTKFLGKNKGCKTKDRQIFMSSHIDRRIYQYYSYLLNEEYNKVSITLSLDDVAIAYRSDLGKSNIHFAKEAFDFIRQQDNCIVIVGDFKDFFDTLDHQYLKQQICNVLNTTVLPNDFYKVFRSITKFSYVEYADILKCYGLEDTKENRKIIKQQRPIITIAKLRDYNNKSKAQDKNNKIIKTNTNNYGIPQGSPISAVFANIYMRSFDYEMNNYIKQYHGKYMRYSDDTIFIIPISNISQAQKFVNEIYEMIKSIPRLTLQVEKTKVYHFKDNELKNIDYILEDNRTSSRNVIDYLGFEFDGQNVYLRPKTCSKFYYRAYKKIKTIVKHKGISPNGKKISCKNLYEKYSIKGAYIDHGNFISYVLRCKKIFGANEKIHKPLNVHMGRIKKRLRTKYRNKNI